MTLAMAPPVGLRPAQAASPGSNDAQGIAHGCDHATRWLACSFGSRFGADSGRVVASWPKW